MIRLQAGLPAVNGATPVAPVAPVGSRRSHASPVDVAQSRTGARPIGDPGSAHHGPAMTPDADRIADSLTFRTGGAPRPEPLFQPHDPGIPPTGQGEPARSEPNPA